MALSSVNLKIQTVAFFLILHFIISAIFRLRILVLPVYFGILTVLENAVSLDALFPPLSLESLIALEARDSFTER